MTNEEKHFQDDVENAKTKYNVQQSHARMEARTSSSEITNPLL